MTTSLHHSGENHSNHARDTIAKVEPRSLRTFTPTQAVLARSAGVFHWTPEGKRLYDFSSGVLVANLGHNPTSWLSRFKELMGWDAPSDGPYTEALTLTAYNAITPLEAEASEKLLATLRGEKGGSRMQTVMWAASGSEAVQKAIWAAMARDKTREMILATRFGFHGKKGLAGAVTGSETDKERDPRVRFISFPMAEIIDLSKRGQPIDLGPYRRELEALYHQFGRRLTALITEPYIGGGGSYHPPAEYLQLLQAFCREHDIVFILDEVQANFGRTRELFAYSAYGLEPDIVVLGKGLGNGVPVAAAVGRQDLFSCMDFGEGSDTWSANPMCCAAVLATLEEFAAHDIIGHSRHVSRVIEEGLIRLKSLPFVAHVRGENEGMVWGVEFKDHAGKTAAEWANAAVLACYQGDGVDGIHLLGPLAKKVVRISPPLTMSEIEARESMELMFRSLSGTTRPVLAV
ncbi:MAG: aminotransferase class III-fold pyridoxal phosphate-dependent enzyme [Planctomycetia bacterium]|nr:aminotransferase class III-fold pyridoxal phosphate-dependent enzyme [Planctomycetia bacterium]